jgi:hypothetical protein
LKIDHVSIGGDRSCIHLLSVCSTAESPSSRSVSRLVSRLTRKSPVHLRVNMARLAQLHCISETARTTVRWCYLRRSHASFQASAEGLPCWPQYLPLCARLDQRSRPSRFQADIRLYCSSRLTNSRGNTLRRDSGPSRDCHSTLGAVTPGATHMGRVGN